MTGPCGKHSFYTERTGNVLQAKEIELPKEILDVIKEWKDKPGNLIMVMHKIQSHYGYIPRDVALQVSKELNTHLAKIYGVATFYHFFKLQKPGKHRISVCTGTACYLKGAEKLIETLETHLDIKEGQTTKDDQFSLDTLRCVGCCGLAPVMMIDDEVYGNMTPKKIPAILEKYKNK